MRTSVPQWPTALSRRFSSQILVVLLLSSTVVLCFTSQALALGTPLIKATGFSNVTETSATLEATIDPNGAPTSAHFEYIPLGYFEATGFQGAQSAPVPDASLPSSVKGTGDLIGPVSATGDLSEGSAEVTNVNVTSGSFAVGQGISGEGLPTGTRITAIDSDALILSASVQTGKSGASVSLSGEASNRVRNPAVIGVGSFAPGQAITSSVAGALEPETKIESVGANPDTGQSQLVLTKPAAKTVSGAALSAVGPQPLSVQVTGLAPGAPYSFRVVARNAKNPSGQYTPGTELTFYTLAPQPLFGACANDPFRSGEFAPLGHPSALLPDCRAYEQATAVEKDGGDAVDSPEFAKAAAVGSGVVFASSFGVPGGQGAQGLPTFAAIRSPDGGGWSSRGLLAPAASGEASQVLGWTADFSSSFASATRLGGPLRSALFEIHRDGSTATQMTAYAPFDEGQNRASPFSKGLYVYAGASAGGRIVALEARTRLPGLEGEASDAAAVEGSLNVYAWDRASGEVHLASVMNDGGSPPKGAVAGPYAWAAGTNSESLKAGGAAFRYYTQDEHAISADGSIFFTALGSGQLYERINPTAGQSAVIHSGETSEECIDAAKACTIHISQTERSTPDTAGEQPAAFMAASADGSEAFFTSSEKLTADANTGPAQPPAQIGRAQLNGDAAAGPVKEDALPTHALGLAVDPAEEHIYWANPASGTIGRAKLNPATGEPEAPIDNSYITPGETAAEAHPVTRPGVIESAPSAPRYVAVSGEYVYWTNTGPLGANSNIDSAEEPVDGAGTIGRAKIGAGAGEEVEPEFITGASNPQGIAINADHIYWANRGVSDGAVADTTTIARATLQGQEVDQRFIEPGISKNPYGVALTPSFVYFSFADFEEGVGGYVKRVPLGGGEGEFLGLSAAARPRGIAVDEPYLYWAAKGENSIGRIPVSDFTPVAPFSCDQKADCQREFITSAGPPTGLAVSGGRLYFSVNGEAPSNPGNDLYRYSSEPDAQGHHLTDLTPEPAGDGAEVQGVLAASADGSYVYLAADGDLDGAGGPAEPGDCKLGSTSGSCSLYLFHAGALTFIAPLSSADDFDWFGTAQRALGGGLPDKEKPAFLGDGGRALLFMSHEQLTAYDNADIPELYRFEAGDPEIRCVSCPPSADAAGAAPSLGSTSFPGIGASPPAAIASHLLSADGDRAFFESSEGLVGADTNGKSGCPHAFNGPSCLDVYEWEAAGSGSCEEAHPSYSPVNGGCLYLISAPGQTEPQMLADASVSGEDVFFFTRARLAGQDTDELYDVYDARVGGGLAGQSPSPQPPCESAEGCHEGALAPPAQPAPGTAGFSAPGEAPPKPRCPKGKVRRHNKCVKKPGRHKHKHKRHHRQAAPRGGASR